MGRKVLRWFSKIQGTPTDVSPAVLCIMAPFLIAAAAAGGFTGVSLNPGKSQSCLEASSLWSSSRCSEVGVQSMRNGLDGSHEPLDLCFYKSAVGQ